MTTETQLLPDTCVPGRLVRGSHLNSFCQKWAWALSQNDSQKAHYNPVLGKLSNTTASTSALHVTTLLKGLFAPLVKISNLMPTRQAQHACANQRNYTKSIICSTLAMSTTSRSPAAMANKGGASIRVHADRFFFGFLKWHGKAEVIISTSSLD